MKKTLVFSGTFDSAVNSLGINAEMIEELENDLSFFSDFYWQYAKLNLIELDKEIPSFELCKLLKYKQNNNQ